MDPRGEEETRAVTGKKLRCSILWEQYSWKVGLAGGGGLRKKKVGVGRKERWPRTAVLSGRRG